MEHFSKEKKKKENSYTLFYIRQKNSVIIFIEFIYE